MSESEMAYEMNELDLECTAIENLIIEAKIQTAIFHKQKRVLLEEVHRQYLEGELDPKKRMKITSLKTKKAKI